VKKLLIPICCLIAFSSIAQNVGIGITSPGARLHVANGSSGYAGGYFPGAIIEGAGSSYLNFLTPNNQESGVLFGKTINAADCGIVFNNPGSPDGLQFRTGGNNTSMTITAGGRVGINTSSPTEMLEVSGNTKASAYKYSTPKIHYYSVPPASFQPRQSSDALRIWYNEVYYTSAGILGEIFAPVHLPDRATVISFTVYYEDASPTVDFEVSLYGVQHSGVVGFPVAILLSSGSPGNTSGTINLTTPELILNNSNTYFIIGRPVTGTSLVPWPTSSLKLRSAVIAYTLSEAQ